MENPSPSSQHNVIRAGDVEVLKVKLHSSEHSKPFDLSLVWQNISIFEDMKMNYIMGQITIADTQNLMMDAPIVGNEKIEIVFRTPSGETSDRYSFTGHLISVKNRLPIRQGFQMYVLEFISPEFVKNHLLKFSKSYNEMLISDMVQDIYSQYIRPVANKELVVSPTLNIDSKVVPSLSPMKAINWLTKWAKSPAYRIGASYVFFENQYGYYFGPIEALIDSDNYGNPSAVYSMNNVHMQQDKEKDISLGFYNIVSNKMTDFNHLDHIKDGMFSSSVKSHDIVRRRINTQNLNYFSLFPELVHLNTNQNQYNTQVNNNTQLGEYHSTKEYIVPVHYSAYDNDLNSSRSDTIISIRNSQLKQYGFLEFDITIPGDNQRTIGEVIELRLPSIGTQTLDERQGEQDKYLSGRYLINALRHEISREGSAGRIKYYTHMTVVNDSYKNPLPTQRVTHWA